MSNGLTNLLINGTFETLYMVLLAGLMAVVVGLPLGMILVLTRADGLAPHRMINSSLGFLINVTRSIPFIILLIALIPLTRMIVGTSIGTTAAIVPLCIGAIPFFARIGENALAEVSFGLIEAGLSMGATHRQIMIKIMLPEALPSLVNGTTLMLIALVGYSAMAGTVGGGGLGAVAINYGYQRFDSTVMITTVVVLVLIVTVIQWLGDRIVQMLSR